MPPEFVPFFPTVAAKIKPGAPSSFAPVTVSAPTTTTATAPAPAPAHKHEVKVEVKRDGDRIASIRIQCKCGEIIELECE